MVFFGCQEEGALAPELNQSDQTLTSLAKKPPPSLTSTITYEFVGHLGVFDTEGRLQIWDGEIHGDIEGQILWWFVLGDGGGQSMPDPAVVAFYKARWEIFDGDDLILAGESGGSTATPPGKDSIWKGNGIVTEAGTGFEDWIGRQVSEGGNVDWEDNPWSGEGIFRIN